MCVWVSGVCGGGVGWGAREKEKAGRWGEVERERGKNSKEEQLL